MGLTGDDLRTTGENGCRDAFPLDSHPLPPFIKDRLKRLCRDGSGLSRTVREVFINARLL
jgi:hypothetical protein